MSHKDSESQAADGKGRFPFIGLDGNLEYAEVDGTDAAEMTAVLLRRDELLLLVKDWIRGVVARRSEG